MKVSCAPLEAPIAIVYDSGRLRQVMGVHYTVVYPGKEGLKGGASNTLDINGLGAT